MPMAISPDRPPTGVTRFTGGYLVKGNGLVEEDLWISSITGKILCSQEVFYDYHVVPDEVIDLKGKILAPGFIDVQLNGAFGFDFSTVPDDMTDYKKGLNQLNKQLIRTGVTSYLPTLPSQEASIYHATLPHLGPSGFSRNPSEGSESLGAHCEGPFIATSKCGIHSPSVLRSSAPNGIRDFEDCYGDSNLSPSSPDQKPSIALITAAPELPGIASIIPQITSRGIRFALGHTEATYEAATTALQAGATMITHLFNAMRPLHHRNPGPFGTLGKTSNADRPYFGIIADGIHLHPTTVKIAYTAHPEGFILVTDAMKTLGLPDGTYDWTNGDKWEKVGSRLTREGTDTLAGSCATLIECVENFWQWSGAGLPEVVRAVTAAPAEMLGMEGVKGSLKEGADADLVVLDAKEINGKKKVEVEGVWKFGVKVC